MLTKQALGIGILIALLATACAPQVQVKGEAKGNGIGNGAQLGKDAGKTGDAASKSAVGEGLNKITANPSDEDGAKKDAEAAKSEQPSKDKVKDQLLAGLLEDAELKEAIAAFEKKEFVDCNEPSKYQIRSQCKDNLPCDVSLDLTCTSRITTKKDVQALVVASTAAALALAPGGAGAAATAAEAVAKMNDLNSKSGDEVIDRGEIYRVTVIGSIDYAKNSAKWDLTKTMTKKIQVKAEDWKEVK